MTAETRKPRRRGRAEAAAPKPERKVDYHTLKNPFPPIPVFTDDRVEAIHQEAFRVLEELGVKILLPEARERFRKAGARVDEASEMVWIGRDIVEAALESAPKTVSARAGAPHRDLTLELGRLTIQSGGGAPHATDLKRGRRPGSMRDFEELTRIVQGFDVLQLLGPSVEPQDAHPSTRHYAVTRASVSLSDKFPFVFSRGAPQVRDAFEIIRLARGRDQETFEANPHCYTIINTNSPRTIDSPMAQGLIDFALAGQLSIVTPFCLMGAMAPVSVAGALLLSHAEALAAISLVQHTRPGAPIFYGAFISNVDMKSGAPAFGTPEQVKASLGAGQLARRIGLPWRGSAGCAANVGDAQAAHETQMSAWGGVLAGCTMLKHGAGWLEGGLTLSYEKLITDLEAMQIFAELCAPTPSDEPDLAFDAIAEVAPSGHFFAAGHTMERYRTAFYDPLIADWSNFGTWTERGSVDATERATKMWEQMLAEPSTPLTPADRLAEIDAFIARRTEEGGAPPVA